MSPLLKVENLCKSYSTPVLMDFDIEIETGEIHALMGSNGAGKSTLAKVLTGLTDFSSGTLTLAGETYRPSSKRAASEAGIVMVMQELNTIPTLSVAENLFFHKLPNRFGIVSKKEMRIAAREALDKVNLGSVDPDQKASTLGVGQQQLLEIASALSQDCRLLILDEPTAALTDSETEILFEQTRNLSKQGVSVIYISHRMDEIRSLCDRVTVMRDGRRISTRISSEIDTAMIVRDMSGQEVWQRNDTQRNLGQAPVVLEAKHLSSENVADLNLSLKKGEILGIAGLVGSGRTESLRLLYGADPVHSGDLLLHGKPLTLKHPADAVRSGIGMIPEDRKSHGLLLSQNLRFNATLSNLSAYSSLGCIDRRDERQAAVEGLRGQSVKYDHLEQTISELSGGNQQKVVLLRWLLRESSILLLDEPTRGIDVVAKGNLYDLIRSLAESGKSLIIVSSELIELMSICDRIIVLCGGCVVDEFTPDTWSQEAITRASFGSYLESSSNRS